MNDKVGRYLSVRKLQNILCGLLFMLVASPAVAQQESRILRSGWYQWDPYQYETVKSELKYLTGLDVQLLKAIFGKMGYELQIDPVGWRRHQEDLKDGKRDIAGGAFKSKERDIYAYYSIPYRSEKDMLYVRKEGQQKFAFDTVAELVKTLESSSYKLGVIEGYFYGVPLMQYINDPRNADRIIKVKDDRENFTNLLEH